MAEIEGLIGDLAHRELVAQQQVAVWTPEVNLAGFAVTTMALQALPDELVIGLNAGEGADLSAVANSIPAGHQFAVAISGESVQPIIAQTLAAYRFAAADLPRRLSVNEHEVQLRALDVCVAAPVIRVRGAGTARDPFLGRFTLHARIGADIALAWQPHRIGTASPS